MKRQWKCGERRRKCGERRRKCGERHLGRHQRLRGPAARPPAGQWRFILHSPTPQRTIYMKNGCGRRFSTLAFRNGCGALSRFAAVGAFLRALSTIISPDRAWPSGQKNAACKGQQHLKGGRAFVVLKQCLSSALSPQPLFLQQHRKERRAFLLQNSAFLAPNSARKGRVSLLLKQRLSPAEAR